MSALPSEFSPQRLTVLATSALVALCSGTNYVVSAYAPQLAAQLHLTHTQLNVVAIAGNFGVYTSGPFTGRIMDTRGSRPLLTVAFVALLGGYLGIRHAYDRGLLEGEDTLSQGRLLALIFCSYLTGVGGNSAMSSAMNSAAKSFADRARAVVVGIVMSGFGLSAFFFSTLSHVLFPDNTSDFLLVLGLGTALPMLLGLVFVRPIPLPPHQHAQTLPSAERAGSGPAYRRVSFDGAPAFVRANSQTRLLHADSAPPLSSRADDEDAPMDGIYTEFTSPFASRSSSQARLTDSVQLTPAVETLSHRSVSRGPRMSARDVAFEKTPEGRGVDLHRMTLFRSPDFWIACLLNVLFSGTGIMYINNVGSIAQALFAQGNPGYDQQQAAMWQTAQVSTISVMNFAGRIAIGVAADLTKQRAGQPRAFCMTGVAALFVISQLVLIATDNVQNLWIASACLGFAYGSLFGLLPTLAIEWFGLAHFSENWGFISLFPVVGGNLFSIAFGRNLDAHAAPHASEALASAALAAASSVLGGNETELGARGGLPSDDGAQCFEGRACYVHSVYMTLGACILAALLAIWAGYRDWHHAREKRDEIFESVLWEEDEE